ncbi:MAG TPA: response regulator [Myxococcales bacterium]|nr:response regulator [Myxococcales bacterium]
MATRARRVFVIDDDHSVRRGLARLLVAAGFQVETYESGPAFLDRAPPRGDHCLIVDVRMPGMSGLELRDALRAEGRDSPVIFITAHGIDEIEGELSMETVLAKPIEADLLVRAIDAAVSNRPSRPSKRARAGRR